MARQATTGWHCAIVSIDYPGPMRHGQPVSDPRNMGGGSVESDFGKALGCAVQVINDAAMQALPWEHHA